MTLEIKSNHIYQEDCISFMQKVREELVDVIITSPPYNIEKDYGSYKDDMPRDGYLNWMEKVAELSKSIPKENGSFLLNMGGRPSESSLNRRRCPCQGRGTSRRCSSPFTSATHHLNARMASIPGEVSGVVAAGFD